MRQGISDEFIKVIFNYPTHQDVSLKISLVRTSLIIIFTPGNIGFGIARNDYIQRHVTDFANRLYNPEPERRRAIAYVDCTYLDIEKSTCFKALRQSYCVHKSKHLIKPSMIVAPDGHILDIQGPYFSNARNNDTSILVNEFQREVNNMRAWSLVGIETDY